MEKSPDAFRTISEAAEELNLPQHVLRFWETRFSTIKPLKRGGGRRYYRPEDVLLLKGIRHLLYDQGFTIKGVQRILKDQGARFVAGIANGGSLEAIPRHAEDADDGEPPVLTSDADAAPAASSTRLMAMPSNTPILTNADREKLGAVLRDLLECKRMLERARET